MGQGHMRLRVPTFLDRICGVKSGLPCYMIITDLHLLWWYGPESMDVKPDHAYCLLEQQRVSLTQQGGCSSKFVVRIGLEADDICQFESEQQDSALWASCFEQHANLAGKVAGRFPEPNLPVPPCLNDLKERDMPNIIRPPGGGCSERCSQYAMRMQGVSTVSRVEKLQQPSQIEMQSRQPLRTA